MDSMREGGRLVVQLAEAKRERADRETRRTMEGDAIGEAATMEAKARKAEDGWRGVLTDRGAERAVALLTQNVADRENSVCMDR